MQVVGNSVIFVGVGYCGVRCRALVAVQDLEQDQDQEKVGKHNRRGTT